MKSGSAAESTPAPESDSAQSDPTPEFGTAPDAGPAPRPGAASGADVAADADTADESDAAAVSDTAAISDLAAESGGDDADAPAASSAQPRGRIPAAGLTGGIGCAALLLPLVAVAGAVLCFAAGILSTATGCSPNGSALCSSNGAWYSFALPVFVSPLVAAVTAIGAVTVRRHRSTWLAVGYGIVFISIIVGLASASTGSG